jgi:hypothetical protein
LVGFLGQFGCEATPFCQQSRENAGFACALERGSLMGKEKAERNGAE